MVRREREVIIIGEWSEGESRNDSSAENRPSWRPLSVLGAQRGLALPLQLLTHKRHPPKVTDAAGRIVSTVGCGKLEFREQFWRANVLDIGIVGSACES
jgi:hypothetical protein